MSSGEESFRARRWSLAERVGRYKNGTPLAGRTYSLLVPVPTSDIASMIAQVSASVRGSGVFGVHRAPSRLGLGADVNES